jgi:hypothetical protein
VEVLVLLVLLVLEVHQEHLELPEQMVAQVQLAQVVPPVQQEPLEQVVLLARLAAMV